MKHWRVRTVSVHDDRVGRNTTKERTMNMNDERWISLDDDGDYESPELVRYDHFYHFDEIDDEGFGHGGRWMTQSPANFFLVTPRYNDCDAIVGSTFHPLPAAQQYGLKLTAWVQAAWRFPQEIMAPTDDYPF